MINATPITTDNYKDAVKELLFLTLREACIQFSNLTKTDERVRELFESENVKSKGNPTGRHAELVMNVIFTDQHGAAMNSIANIGRMVKEAAEAFGIVDLFSKVQWEVLLELIKDADALQEIAREFMKNTSKALSELHTEGN